MAINYAYKYALVDSNNGWCLEVRDTTDYILDPTYVPVPGNEEQYLLNYYWPLPSAPVTSFNDFHGTWWTNEEHTSALVISNS